MAPGFRVRVLVVLVLETLRVAVTPAGTPDTDKLTLPLNPTGLTTLIVLFALAPPTRRVRLLVDEERPKLGDDAAASSPEPNIKATQKSVNNVKKWRT